MNRKLFGLVVAALFFYVTAPLVFPVAMGGVIAVLFMPTLERLEHRKIGTGSGAALLTLGITLGLLIPMAALLYFAARTGVQQVQIFRLQNSSAPGTWFLDTTSLKSSLDWLQEWIPIEPQQLIDAVQDAARSVGLRLAELLGDLASHLPKLVMSLVVIVVSVYFFLVDGRKLVFFFRRSSAFTPQQTDLIIHSLAGVCRSVILASVVSGAVQSLLMALVSAIARVPNAPLIGLLVFMGSFVPVVGSAPVTLGVATHQLLVGRASVAFVLYFTAVVVMAIDNFIRPIFLKGSANLHPMLAFVAAFGGLQMLGFLGVFLGPVIAALFVVTLEVLSMPDENAKPLI